MSEERIKIERSELFSAAVDEAVARSRARQGRSVPANPELGFFRKLRNESLIYMPLAGALAALVTFAVLEPHIDDHQRVAGEVVMVDDDTFDYAGTSLTINGVRVIVMDGVTQTEGELDSVSDIRLGDFVEVVGESPDGNFSGDTIAAWAVRRVSEAEAAQVAATGSPLTSGLLMMALFVIVLVGAVLFLLVAEAISARNWSRSVPRILLGTLLALVFCALAMIPAGLIMNLGLMSMPDATELDPVITVHDMSTLSLLLFMAARSAAWACLGAGAGLGMNLVKSSGAQLRNSVVGGAIGGSVGGALFDPLQRFLSSESIFGQAALSRGVGLIMLGAMIGLFCALVDRLSREAWLRVRTGPLAGKAFVLYKTPTVVGSAPDCDIYLFKDAEIDSSHVRVHRVGNAYEIEDLNSRMGTRIGDRRVRRNRLRSGDQIVLGATVLEFEERQKKSVTQGVTSSSS